MIYLASPYSHDDQAVMIDRFHKVCEAAATLIGAGHHVYSPIAHSHPISQHGDLPGDWGYWQEQDERMLSICDSLVVLQLDGWEISAGVRAEMQIADRMGLPVEFMTV